jgi:hypothetical protein
MMEYTKGILVFILFLSANSHAGLISVDALADMSSGYSNSKRLLPIGTTVSANVQFDVGSGTVHTSSFSNVSGDFSWTDTTFGLQTFTANSARITSRNAAGLIGLKFTGIGQKIRGLVADSFMLVFDIGVNPFSSPGSTTQFYDLVLGSSVSNMRVGARQDRTTHYGYLKNNVTGSIISVPGPGTLPLFLLGLFAVFASRVPSNKQPQ